MALRSRVILIGAVTLIAGLVIFFPARIAYHWFAPPTIRLASINGSVWYGDAGEASAGGVYLHDLRWRFRPLALLTGKLGYAIEASPVSGFIDATVAVGITGTITATDLTGSMSLQSLQQVMGMPGLRGKVSVQFEELRLRDGLPVVADGVVEIANLVLPIVDRSPIGGYRAKFVTQDSGVVATVEDTDGVVDIAGSLLLSADRSYRFVAQLAAKTNTPANIRQQMQFLGSANERGQHEMRLEGQL